MMKNILFGRKWLFFEFAKNQDSQKKERKTNSFYKFLDFVRLKTM